MNTFDFRANRQFERRARCHCYSK